MAPTFSEADDEILVEEEENPNFLTKAHHKNDQILINSITILRNNV